MSTSDLTQDTWDTGPDRPVPGNVAAMAYETYQPELYR